MKHKGITLSSESEQECDGAHACPPGRLKSVDISDYKLFEEEQRTTQIIYSYKGGKKVPKLREPRNLFAFNEERKLQAPRWPGEMKVLNIRPRFIEYTPKEPEPFCKQEASSTLAGLCKAAEESGQLVYDNAPGSEKYFLHSRVGGTTIPNKPFYNVQSADDHTLVFESRFESGNLKRAIKVGPYEYQLWMRTDMYTVKHTQWFFFRVRNTKAAITYRFHIMNFIKSNSLYNDGMQPLMYSEMDAYKNKTGWVRTGINIKYYKNEIRREDTTKDRYHYTLTWSCQFQYNRDTCYFAHCYPYTYSDLQEYLAVIRNDPIKTRLCKQRVLCRTLCGNFVHILTITNPSRRPADAEAKRAVVITARVHPGETNSSWMMKGLLDFLTSNNPDAKLLRDTFVFKIVPMINPDGVIVGNYRCSLTGRDLNRNYKTSLKDSFPPIWHIKNMVKKLLEEREIVLYCDFHGHSRKQNVFMYGCDNKRNIARRLRERIFPMMMSKNAPCKFSYKGCKFKVQKSKEGTGRIVMWNLGIMNSFTMESTFCGSNLGKRNGFHFSPVDLEAMGYHICDTLLDYCDPDNTKYIQLLRELEEKFKEDILDRMKKKGTAASNMTTADINLEADYLSDIESSTGGSDSSVSDGLPMHLIYAPHSVQYNQNSKKKKLKSRKERNKRRAKAMKIKNVLLTDTQKPDMVEETMAKTSYKKITKNNSSSRQKYESNPLPKNGNQVVCNSPPMRLCKEHALNNKGAEYLEAVTNAYMLSGLLVSDLKSDLPHFSYTDGSVKDVHTANTGGRFTRWSTDSGGGCVASGATQQSEEEEGNFTVSYLAKQLEKNTDCTIPLSRSDARISSAALDLARKITMYNSRYRIDQLKDQEMPILRPASPSALWRNPTISKTGKFLSSTKAPLHEIPRRYQSSTDLGSSTDVGAPKPSRSVQMTGTYSDDNLTYERAVIRPVRSEEKQVLYRRRPEMSKKFDLRRDISKEVSSKPMNKYTTLTGGRTLNKPSQSKDLQGIQETSQSSKSSKPSSIMSTSSSIAQSSPKYVALNRHQVLEKKQYWTSVGDQQSTSNHHRTSGRTPSDLKTTVYDPQEEPGKLVSYALQRQNQEPQNQIKMVTSDNVSRIPGFDSNDDDDSGPFISKFSKIGLSSPRREAKVFNFSCNQANIPFVTSVNKNLPETSNYCSLATSQTVPDNQHSNKVLTAESQTEKEASNRSLRNSPPLSTAAAPSKISLTFKTGGENKTENPTNSRQGAFVPHFKHFYKSHR